ncbi:mitochondrial carrier domain-containing protein [Podospora didyma]|uniref:Mitochondrial carrier domain-containing protein n=1 Tax=Podospora didyma TaxID=330526 RepID=A0AAE0NY23_9PEZI|nr:mitochondrial carrier domain-containing protein [Podospora didyma]
MAQETDTESQTVAATATPATEQTPLLSDGQSDDQSTQVENDTDTQKPGTEKKQLSWYLWRFFWAILAALVLGVFIKGWIDAGSDAHFDVGQALWKALGGGLAGGAAMILQVLLLMPLRTIMNYQYRFGGEFQDTTKNLYREGGFGRYYQGLGAALIQAPVARFGDAAANAGIFALLGSNSYLKDLPSGVKTVFVSLCVAGFRIILTPIDTLKTTLQTQGARGTTLLRQRIKEHGLGSLYWGALATAAATLVGNYPWWATINFLDRDHAIPEVPKDQILLWLLRLAFIGFVASVISDSVSNSFRVVKTYRQVNDTKVSYAEAATVILRTEGVRGLLGRGLKTRILCNGLQGLLFTILWRLLLDLWNDKTKS